MNEHERLAYGYRQKAVELRAMASDFTSKQNGHILEKLAADYEQLATTQERLAALDKAQGES